MCIYIYTICTMYYILYMLYTLYNTSIPYSYIKFIAACESVSSQPLGGTANKTNITDGERLCHSLSLLSLMSKSWVPADSRSVTTATSLTMSICLHVYDGSSVIKINKNK